MGPHLLDNWEDWVRLIVTAQATFCVGLTVLVAVLFSAKNRPLPAGVARWHAWAMALSLVVLTWFAAWEVSERWTKQAPITWRSPLCLIAFTAQIAALASLLYRFAREDRRRWHRAHDAGIS